MLFGYFLCYVETQNLDVNKTKHGSGHCSSVLWDDCASLVVARRCRTVA